MPNSPIAVDKLSSTRLDSLKTRFEVLKATVVDVDPFDFGVVTVVTLCPVGNGKQSPRQSTVHTTLSGLIRPKTGPSRRDAGVGEEERRGEERSCGEFEVNQVIK